MVKKANQITKKINWHFIEPLQRRHTKKVPKISSMTHTVKIKRIPSNLTKSSHPRRGLNSGDPAGSQAMIMGSDMHVGGSLPPTGRSPSQRRHLRHNSPYPCHAVPHRMQANYLNKGKNVRKNEIRSTVMNLSVILPACPNN